MDLSSLTQYGSRYPRSTVSGVGSDGVHRTLTFPELFTVVDRLAARLRHSGLRDGDILALRSPNCLDWILWDLALTVIGALLHAIPDDLPADGPPLSEMEANSRASIHAGPLHHEFAIPLNTCWSSDMSPLPLRSIAQREERRDVHSLVYSSGTTGTLKGIAISRRGTEYVIEKFIDAYELDSNDRHLIFLPLSNYQQRMSLYGCLSVGTSVSLTTINRAFQSLRAETPTFVIAPPVFYNTLLQLVGTSPAAAPSIAAALGGCVRFLITGMAPIARSTLDAFWADGIPLLEAYGMTECGMIAWNTPKTHRIGTVGRPLDPRHIVFSEARELLVHRECPLSVGYFRSDPDESAATFRPGGVIATGDIAHFDSDAFLVFDGRIKDLISLSNGIKVSPSEIEARIRMLPGVADVVAVGRPHGNGIASVIVVANGGKPLRLALERNIQDMNRNSLPYQRIKTTVFTREPVTQDPRFLTPNLKINRSRIASFFEASIERLGVVDHVESRESRADGE